MPRKPRFNLLGVAQHVIQRGNNREPCFLAAEDYRFYLDGLVASAKKYGCQVHSYVLMANHVHLLMTPTIDYGISQTMQALGRRYVAYINHTYHRTGTLWEGRYKSSLVDSERYLLTGMRYIELNPVRAAMVSHPGEYQWSSYRRNGQGTNDPVVCPHELYTALGETAEAQQRTYRDLFCDAIDADTIHDIRGALNHETVLGNSYFKAKINAMTQRATDIRPAGRPRIGEECSVYEY